MPLALEYEPAKHEEQRPEQQQPDTSLDEDAVAVLALVTAPCDELESAVADELDEIGNHVLNHLTIVACRYGPSVIREIRVP